MKPRKRRIFQDSPNYDKEALRRLLSFRRITDNGCWEFIGNRYLAGYGQINYRGRNWLAHRLAFMLLRPDEYNTDLLILHKCDNRHCFNPEHLFIGDYSDNMKDAIKKGRRVFDKKTHCIHGHEFTPANTYIDKKDGGRHCRKCHSNRTTISRWLK